MSNSSQYKAMMGEVHASADLIGKVKGIPMEKTKKRTTALKFATATCAALLGVFVVTNGVCYAATGTYEKDGATYVYQVSGEPGNWHASVHLEGVDAAPSAAAEAR